MGARRTQQDYLALAEEHNFKWLGKELPKNSHTSTDWFCEKCNHVWRSTFQRIRMGKGCPFCAKNAPKTPQDYEFLAKDHGLQWLGPLPANTASHTAWKCLRCGYGWETSYSSVSSHLGCPKCGRVVTSAKLRLQPSDYTQLAENIGYRWLGPDVKRGYEATNWLCAKQHRFSISYKIFQKTLRSGALPCRKCCLTELAQRKRKTIEDFHKLAAEKRVIFLGPMPLSIRMKSFWQCSCGKVFETSYQSILRYLGLCPACALQSRASKRRHTAEDYRDLAERKGFKWTGECAPPNGQAETGWHCNQCGCEFSSSYARVRRNRHCPNCTPVGRKTREDYFELASRRKVAWSGERVPANTHERTTWICFKCKQELTKSYDEMQTLHGCPWCTFQIINGARASLVQLSLGETLKRILHAGVQVNEKIEGVSVDLYVIYKGKGLCVFYDSSTWHTIPGAAERDAAKSEVLVQAGYWVLRVRSDSNLPSKHALDDALNQLSNENPLVFLVLSDWGLRPGFHERSRDNK